MIAREQSRFAVRYPDLYLERSLAARLHGNMGSCGKVQPLTASGTGQTVFFVSSEVWGSQRHCECRIAALLGCPYGIAKLSRLPFLLACQQSAVRKTYADLPDVWNLRLHLLPLLVKMHPEQAP